jgi:hypothetical protein
MQTEITHEPRGRARRIRNRRIERARREQIRTLGILGLNHWAVISHGAAPPAPWAPTDLGSKLYAWYRADLGVTTRVDGSDTYVTAWADQSGNGHHLAEATDANQPLVHASRSEWGGQAAFEFGSIGGTTRRLISTEAASVWKLRHDGNGAEFIAFHSTSTSATQRILSTKTNTTSEVGLTQNYNGSTNQVFSTLSAGAGNTNVALNVAGAWYANTSHLLYSGWASSANYQQHFADGSQTADQTGYSPSASDPSHTLTLGVRPGTTLDAFQGTIPEIMIFAGPLTSGERADLTAYLEARYAPEHYVHYLAQGTTTALSGSSVTPLMPGVVMPGEILIGSIVSKTRDDLSDPGPMPSGWTMPANGQRTGGAGTTNIDTGSVTTTVFWKLCESTSEAAPTVPINGSATGKGAIGKMQRFARTGPVVSIACANGQDATAGTLVSFTVGSDPGISSGDLIVVNSGTNTDAFSHSGESLTVPGCTVGTGSEILDAQNGSGDDVSLVIAHFPITAGASTGAATFETTASGSTADAPMGAAILTRIRCTG